MRDIPETWVIVAKDGLMWRYRPVRGHEDAVAYARLVGAVDGAVMGEI
jgi:hypothetical protein